ncbi:MAG: amidase [Actinomycetota bacterium]
MGIESGLAAETRWMDATDQAQLVADGEVTAVELAEAAMERIDALDRSGDRPINAVVMRWFDHARETAQKVDAGSITGPFAGVPFLLKDLWAEYEGFPQSNGNQALKDAAPVADHDATLVARFKDAGLVTLGRTNSPELGSLPVTEPTAWGPTRNPWNPDRTPGGSSGGAGAAVAAGMVPIAHASDGGGSIRIPASCTGLVGLKTSQGRITMGPVRNESGFSVQFCVSRSVRDSARLLDAVHGPAAGDAVVAPAPVRPYVDELDADPGALRIGLLDHRPTGGPPLHPDCAAAVRSAATMLDGLGHHVEPGHPEILDDGTFTQRFMAVWASMMAVGIGACETALGRPMTADDVEPVNWAQAEFSRAITAPAYLEGLAAISDYRRRLQSWWDVDGWDLLLTPTLNLPPVNIGEHLPAPDNPMAGMIRAAEFVGFTPPFNTSGQPAISLPLHWTTGEHDEAGLPVGVQLVAAWGREDLLLRVAAQLEAAHPWADRRPA